MYINLALVRHDKIPVQSSLSDFEKATLRGTIDDLCFTKYSIDFCDILKPDSFFLEKERQLKQENKFYEQQLVRMLNFSVPDVLKKQLGIPFDDGKGLPRADVVKGALRQPEFLRNVQLHEVLTKHHSHEQVELNTSPAPISVDTKQPYVDSQQEVQNQHSVVHVPGDHIVAPPQDVLFGIKMLIDGAPGVGKTTLSWKISKDWAIGELFDEFEIVVRISLRDLPENPQSIREILPLGSMSQRGAVENELLECSGQKILFILDGWDELSSLQREKESLLYRLILGKLLPLSSYHHVTTLHVSKSTATSTST